MSAAQLAPMEDRSRYLREALELARQAHGRTSPNPMVGAVLVKDGEVVGRGTHVWKDKDHAEIAALKGAGTRARGSTLYINLEPCVHQGRTGPCTDALIEAGVAAVVTAMKDPNPLVSGRGLEKLKGAGVLTEVAADFTAQAEKLNEPFCHFMRTGRPLVTLKAALTLDGKIAAPEDNRGWITSEQARSHVQQLRHDSDVILTGIGTVLADDPLLTDRSGIERSRPLLRVVLDSQLRLPPNSRLVTSSKEDLLVVTTSAASAERRGALEAAGVTIVAFDGPLGRTDLHSLIDYLSRERYLSLMVEGGSKVNWSFLESGIVDRIFFYYAPKILGGLQSLPVAGGTGRLRRADAILFRDVTLHQITADEFAVEAYLRKER